MILTFEHRKKTYTARINKGTEIGIPVKRAESVSSFGIQGAIYKTYEVDGFVGSKTENGPCNLETITFTPHGNSTHTECLGHISLDTHFVNDHILDDFYTAYLFSTQGNKGGDLDFDAMDWNMLTELDALVIRTLPNGTEKRGKDYSGKNAPYISTDVMKKIRKAGIKHLIIDLPSVDPEWDNGALAAHHIFWQYPANSLFDCSITEFAYIPDSLTDGTYILKLNISNFVSDAAPSRPVLYPISEV